MRKLLALILLSLAIGVAAAQAGSPSPTQSENKSAAQHDDANKQGNDQEQQQKTSRKDPVDTDRAFNERSANSVLNQIRDGLTSHSQRLLLAAFDSQKMDGYLAFEDQINAFFGRYDSFRVHFRILSTATEGPKGIVLVEAELEEIPASGIGPVRKRSQLRFEFQQGRKGWKIVEMHDRGFFS